MKDIIEELQEANLYAGRASVGAAIERAIARIKDLAARLEQAERERDEARQIADDCRFASKTAIEAGRQALAERDAIRAISTGGRDE